MGAEDGERGQQGVPETAFRLAIPELERQIVVQENLISVLAGENPGPVTRAGAPLKEPMPPDVPAGLPSSLLERRPDIREAEQLVRSANAQVGVAEARSGSASKISLTFPSLSAPKTIWVKASIWAW